MTSPAYVDGLEQHIEELKSELRSHKATIDAMQVERDALAAHLDKYYALVGQSHYDDMFDLIVRELINQSPATSLIRRDLLKQAEALDKALRIMRMHRRDTPTVNALNAAITDVEELRRQAEGEPQ